MSIITGISGVIFTDRHKISSLEDVDLKGGEMARYNNSNIKMFPLDFVGVVENLRTVSTINGHSITLLKTNKILTLSDNLTPNWVEAGDIYSKSNIMLYSPKIDISENRDMQMELYMKYITDEIFNNSRILLFDKPTLDLNNRKTIPNAERIIPKFILNSGPMVKALFLKGLTARYLKLKLRTSTKRGNQKHDNLYITIHGLQPKIIKEISAILLSLGINHTVKDRTELIISDTQSAGRYVDNIGSYNINTQKQLDDYINRVRSNTLIKYKSLAKGTSYTDNIPGLKEFILNKSGKSYTLKTLPINSIAGYLEHRDTIADRLDGPTMTFLDDKVEFLKDFTVIKAEGPGHLDFPKISAKITSDYIIEGVIINGFMVKS